MDAALDAALAGAGPDVWIAFDHAARDALRYGALTLPVYRRTPRGGLGNLLVPGRRKAPGDRVDPESVAGLSPRRRALAACHADGRVRRAALEALAALPELTPLLLLRATDWVPQVREAARTLLEGLPHSTVLLHGSLILRLSRRERGGFARELFGRAVDAATPEVIAALLTDDDRAVRRTAHRTALDRGTLSPARLARIAAADADPKVATMCAEAAVASVRGPGDGPVVDLLLTARNAQVRAAGVTALRRAGRHPEAVAFLADRSGVVRACARYVLRQDGTDPLPRYRELCADAGRHPAAATGLGECGGQSEEDVATLWALTGHPVPAVRVHAVTGLRLLDATRHERLLPLLDDPSSAVVRTVTRALLPDAARLPGARLRDRTADDRPPHVRVAARRLLRAATRQ
ncbi:hypothetical protein [uncultured Streptomyces sp.]|uniref:hypothetical protein n=1 Tax=uncultured Streptomyces sp. TaxID=174707 RepID=UPI00260E5D54|nr:hypothetical protein [uncultured Streptomyces sp.]